MKKLLSALTFSALVSSGFAQAPALFKDIWSGVNSADPVRMTAWNGNFYFSAKDGVNGDALWKSDGTPGGTAFFPNGGTSSPRNFLPTSNYLFFVSGFWTSGYELYRTDGTTAGTILLKDIDPGMNSSSPSNMLDVNGTLFFTATNGTYGNELWKSDGTAAGTVLVKDVKPGTGSSSIGRIATINNTFIFVADDGTNGYALWRSDGTAAGTYLVKALGNSFSDIVTLNNTGYFTVNSGAGNELWITDGTTAGTIMLKDINPGSASAYPGNLTVMNGFLYFSATDGTNGVELWRTDGTAANTLLVKDIAPGNPSALTTVGSCYFTAVNNMLFFTAYLPASGNELWVSDGTAAGTVMVKDIVPGTNSPFIGYVPQFIHCNNKLYFTADDGSTGRELWVSDGTSAGTVLTGEINAGTGNGNITYLTDFNGTLFFAAADAPHGNELWRLGAAVACNPPAITSITTNGAICSNQPFILQPTITGTSPFTYTWTGSGSFSSNSVSSPTVTNASGNYVLTVTNGCGTATLAVTATVTPAPTLSVVASASVVCAGQSVTLTASGATSYSWTGGISNGVSFTPTTTASYTVTGTAGSCSNTAVRTITVDNCTGIREVTHNNNLQIYPNPSTGMFHISSTTEFSEITVYNLLGEICYSEKANGSKASIDLSAQTKGVYFYRITNGNVLLKTGKIILE